MIATTTRRSIPDRIAPHQARIARLRADGVPLKRIAQLVADEIDVPVVFVHLVLFEQFGVRRNTDKAA